MIFVDELFTMMPRTAQAKRFGIHWCHMWTDGDMEELHQFAESIGLQRKWFQDHINRDFRHYDLTPTKRRLALSAGAKEVSLVEKMRQARETYQQKEEEPMEALPEIALALLNEQNFCVLDTETSGTCATSPDAPDTEIVEITILAPDGAILLNSLVKPIEPILDAMTRFHGISNEMVQDAPTFPELYPKIVDACQGKTVIIYNVSYDLTLLVNLAERHNLAAFVVESWCLMEAYADFYKAPAKHGRPGYGWQSLSNACEQQGIVLEGAHRALGDTQATLALLKKLASLA